MLPAESDPTVSVHVLSRREGRRPGGRQERHRGRIRQARRFLDPGPDRMFQERTSQIDFCRYVCQEVLKPLETTDHAAELLSQLGVVNGVGQSLLCYAELFRCDE